MSTISTVPHTPSAATTAAGRVAAFFARFTEYTSDTIAPNVRASATRTRVGVSRFSRLVAVRAWRVRYSSSASSSCSGQ